MSQHGEITLGVTGQSIYLDCPEGRPASDPAPTAVVYSSDEDDDGTAETATTGSVSIDAVSTMIDAAANEGDDRLSVPTAGIVAGRRYRLGGLETVEVVDVDTANELVILRRPLLNAHPEDASLVGIRISIQLHPTWVADKNNLTDECPGRPGYRVRWSYTVDGEPRVAVSYFDVVRYRAQSLVTAADVDDLYPGFIDRLGPDDRADQGASVIRQAHDAVKLDALGDAKALRRIRETFVVGELIKRKAQVIAIQKQIYAGAPNRTEALQVARDEYQQRYDQLVREPQVPVDATGGGASGTARRMPLVRR